MITQTLLPLVLSTFLALALATPLYPRQQSALPVFKVTNFTAFAADPYVDGAQSNLTFHVTDTRPGYEAEVDCIVPNTYFNLYAISALGDVCGKAGDGLDFGYSYGEHGLTVRRGWRVNATTYVTGSAMQEWGWKEGTNATKYPDGVLYVRKQEWLFPVTRVQPGTPP